MREGRPKIDHWSILDPRRSKIGHWPILDDLHPPEAEPKRQAVAHTRPQTEHNRPLVDFRGLTVEAEPRHWPILDPRRSRIDHWSIFAGRVRRLPPTDAPIPADLGTDQSPLLASSCFNPITHPTIPARNNAFNHEIDSAPTATE